MTDIYLVRHGESEGNHSNIFTGQYEVPLTDTGKLQAAKTAEYLSNVKFDAVYSSDLSRAFDTAKFIAEKQGLTVIARKELREICVGEWEGVPFDTVVKKYPDTFKRWREKMYDSCAEGGESMRELNERILTEVTRIAENHDGKSVAVVSHGTPIRVLICKAKGLPFEEIGSLGWVSNASVTHIQFDKNAFKLVSVDYDEHLLGMKTRLSNGI